MKCTFNANLFLQIRNTLWNMPFRLMVISSWFSVGKFGFELKELVLDSLGQSGNKLKYSRNQ